MDHLKYALRDDRRLEALLEGKDHLFVIACGKCFKEYDTVSEPECGRFTALAESLGRHITGARQVDFLCNAHRTRQALEAMLPAGTEALAVIACGLGVQTVAGLTSLPVLAAADTLYAEGHHGMALTEKTCGACAQCYLNLTGGICPITQCSKSLLNGQCGGAKDGRCEVDPTKDCAWEKITQRLEKQGRAEELRTCPVQLRDYSRSDAEAVREETLHARARRFESFYGGIHPEEHKEATGGLPLCPFPEPDTVVLPMVMHIGAPAIPTVKPGDPVQVGQRIAEAGGYVSVPIHASVSGTVIAVEPRPHPTRGSVLSVVIRSDGKNTLHASVKPGRPPEELTPEEIVALVQDKGIVGMGGAAFPTHVKLKPGKPIDAVLINGSECEPYLTADHRILLEYARDVVSGLRIMMKAVGAPEGILLIEDNKPDAIARMEACCAPYPELRVCTAPTRYPEGAEKMLIQKALGRRVPSGKLPADVGCVVCNASTARAVADAVLRGMPLIRRAVTVTGEYIERPGNFLVKVGTPVGALLAHCGLREGGTVKLGGPMMGTPLPCPEVPILKGSNGVIALAPEPTEPRECIKCGRCADVCPMELEPMKLMKYARLGDGEALLRSGVLDCFSCRCCDRICSSGIPLASEIAAGKALLKK